MSAKVDRIGDIKFINLTTATAFEFSSFTGAAYVDNDIFPYSPRPHIKLFDKPFQLHFATGMFENGQAISSVQQMIEMYPIISSKNFKLVVCPFESESQWRRQLSFLIDNQSQGDPFIALRVETSKKGWGLEPLLEWGFSMELKSAGLITETQIPLGATLGTPDAQGYSSPFSRQLIELVTNKAHTVLSVPELLAYQFFGPSTTEHGQWNFDSIVVVGEAKTGGSSGVKQLQKYMNSEFFDVAFFLSDAGSSGIEYRTYLTEGFSVNPKVHLPDQGFSSSPKYAEWLEVTLASTFFASLPKESQVEMLRKLNLDDANTLPKTLFQYGKDDILKLIR
jgi:hypothetical protein